MTFINLCVSQCDPGYSERLPQCFLDEFVHLQPERKFPPADRDFYVSEKHDINILSKVCMFKCATASVSYMKLTLRECLLEDTSKPHLKVLSLISSILAILIAALNDIPSPTSFALLVHIALPFSLDVGRMRFEKAVGRQHQLGHFVQRLNKEMLANIVIVDHRVDQVKNSDCILTYQSEVLVITCCT